MTSNLQSDSCPRDSAEVIPALSPVVASSPPSLTPVRIATWNLSHWSPARASTIAFDLSATITAVQETRLAPQPLSWAQSTAASLDLTLHHGRPVCPLDNSLHGRSCGVGFVSQCGTAVTRVLPQCAPWRRLHSMRRLHVVQLPPCHSLPLVCALHFFAPLTTQEV